MISGTDIAFDKKANMPLTSAEQCLLLLSARLSLDEESAAELRSLLRKKIDWDVVITQSAMHGTTGILYKHLVDASLESSIPEDVLEKMRNLYLQIAASGIMQSAQFKQVSEELAVNKVEIILLKGAALITDVYGDYGLRAMSDIDVLVREQDWPIIYRILKKTGYRLVEKDFEQIPPKLTRYDVEAHVQYISHLGTCLEFQFDLLTIGIGMKDVGGVWARSREIERDGVKVRKLSQEDQLLQLLVHTNRHGCSRLKWIVDITESIHQGHDLDWELFITIVKREKVQAVAYYTLGHVERLIGSELAPREVMVKLKPRFYKSAIWRMVWPRKHLDEFRGRNEDAITFYVYRIFSGWNLLNLALMGRVMDKIDYQMKWIIPPVRWMSETYGERKLLRLIKYYPLRVVNYNLKKKKKR